MRFAGRTRARAPISLLLVFPVAGAATIDQIFYQGRQPTSSSRRRASRPSLSSVRLYPVLTSPRRAAVRSTTARLRPQRRQLAAAPQIERGRILSVICAQERLLGFALGSVCMGGFVLHQRNSVSSRRRGCILFDSQRDDVLRKDGGRRQVRLAVRN